MIGVSISLNSIKDPGVLLSSFPLIPICLKALKIMISLEFSVSTMKILLTCDPIILMVMAIISSRETWTPFIGGESDFLTLKSLGSALSGIYYLDISL